MERIPINWILGIPVVTRTWMVLALFTTVLIDSNIIQLRDMIFYPYLIKQEPWRLITTFLYLGPFNMNLLMTIYIIMQSSRQLEESYRRTRDYLWLLLTCVTSLLLYSTYYKNIGWLGGSLYEVLSCIWSKKNPDMQMGLMGLIEFRAGYLTFLLIFLSILERGNNWDFYTEIAPFFIGHVLFYFDEVWGNLFGFNPLDAPWNWIH